MGYASVMVYVEDVDVADSRVVLACDLAKLFDARLIGVSASFRIPPVSAALPRRSNDRAGLGPGTTDSGAGGPAGRGTLSQHWGRSLRRVDLEGRLV